MEATEQIILTLPKGVAEQVRAAVGSAGATNVSDLVAEILTSRFRDQPPGDEDVTQFLADMSAESGPIDDEARAWARGVMRTSRTIM